MKAQKTGFPVYLGHVSKLLSQFYPAAEEL
jgi:hypothetical protein